jgi:hypothetical protein
LVVRVEVGGEVLADGAGEAALQLVAEEVDFVGPVGAWYLGLGAAELQEVDDDLFEQGFAGVTLAPAQILDLLGQMLNIERAVPAAGAERPQLAGLPLGPGDEVLLVKLGRSHPKRIPPANRTDKLTAPPPSPAPPQKSRGGHGGNHFPRLLLASVIPVTAGYRHRG